MWPTARSANRPTTAPVVQGSCQSIRWVTCAWRVPFPTVTHVKIVTRAPPVCQPTSSARTAGHATTVKCRDASTARVMAYVSNVWMVIFS